MVANFCDVCGSLLNPATGRCPRCFSEPSRPSPPKTARSSQSIAKQGHGLFPYEPRPFQLEIVDAIRNALDSGKHIIMESGTGTGKTVCSLVGTLEHSRPRKKKIIYLTRTVSQSDQVMKELRTIARNNKITGIAVAGRMKSCLLQKQEGMRDVPPAVMARICEDRKARTIANERGGCPYYADFLAIGELAFTQHCFANLPTVGEFDRFCEKQGACPYEARKAIMPMAEIIAVPYIHLLSEDIRNNLFDRLKLEGGDFTVIVDEAHNLIDAARDQESFSISVFDLDSVLVEIREMGNSFLKNHISIQDVCLVLKEIIETAVKELIPARANDARLGRRFLEGRLRQELGLSGEDLDNLCFSMIDRGEKILEDRMDSGKEPVSHILRLGSNLRSWIASSDSIYLKTISADSGGMLVAACLEPNEIAQFLKGTGGAVHMSGTLKPLRQYADLLELTPISELREFPSPFPSTNRLTLYTEDVSAGQREMKEDPSMKARIESYIIDICNATDRNTMVFFRSYEMLKSMRYSIETEIDRKLYWEESGNSYKLANAIEAFKTHKDGVFFTVMGGKIAEGLDFPGQELDIAVIVGIPYPPPTLVGEELKRRYDQKYGPGTGWEYVSAAPAVRKMQQALGRLIRTETDKGAAVILDSRVSRYCSQLDAKPTKDPVKDITDFLGWSRRF
ncbi:ATP-dependent DNA helicase [Candidatus Methanomassiliicoccus intestinalis]|uniref:ATP-dependent DNA helicase n=1 Tax=Candidatus Methanomassiliicoccus intestinalis TaxID=1406512 RepID=UPI0037DCF397